jgi:hypothetical protein
MLSSFHAIGRWLLTRICKGQSRALGQPRTILPGVSDEAIPFRGCPVIWWADQPDHHVDIITMSKLIKRLQRKMTIGIINLVEILNSVSLCGLQTRVFGFGPSSLETLFAGNVLSNSGNQECLQRHERLRLVESHTWPDCFTSKETSMDCPPAQAAVCMQVAFLKAGLRVA